MARLESVSASGSIPYHDLALDKTFGPHCDTRVLLFRITYKDKMEMKRSKCRCTSSPLALATAIEAATSATAQARKSSLATMMAQECNGSWNGWDRITETFVCAARICKMRYGTARSAARCEEARLISLRSNDGERKRFIQANRTKLWLGHWLVTKVLPKTRPDRMKPAIEENSRLPSIIRVIPEIHR